MSYYEFPHSRKFDQDLGWLIEAYQELLKEYQDLLVRVEELEKKNTEVTE